jgi:hypothetical protein
VVRGGHICVWFEGGELNGFTGVMTVSRQRFVDLNHHFIVYVLYFEGICS